MHFIHHRDLVITRVPTKTRTTILSTVARVSTSLHPRTSISLSLQRGESHEGEVFPLRLWKSSSSSDGRASSREKDSLKSNGTTRNYPSFLQQLLLIVIHFVLQPPVEQTCQRSPHSSTDTCILCQPLEIKSCEAKACTVTPALGKCRHLVVGSGCVIVIRWKALESLFVNCKELN